MSDTLPRCMFETATAKWRELAEKRRVHFVDLYESGRWKHYYSESEFIERMRETVRLSELWTGLAPAPEQQAPAE